MIDGTNFGCSLVIEGSEITRACEARKEDRTGLKQVSGERLVYEFVTC